MRRILVFLILWFLFLFSLTYKNLNNYWYSSPDENSVYSFTKNYAETWKLYFELDENLNFPLIHTRGSIIDRYWRLLTTKFLWYSVIIGSIIIVIWSNYINYINIFLNILIILFFILIIKKVYNIRNALISSALFLTFPPILYNLNRGLFEEPLGILFILIWYMLFFFREDKIKYFFLQALFFGLAIFVRPIYVLYVFPISILYLPYIIKNIKQKNFSSLSKNITIFLLTFFITIFPLLYLNKILYWGIFETWYHLMYNNMFYTPFESNITNINNNFLGINWGKLWHNFLLLINISILIFIAFLWKIKNYKDKYIILAFLWFLFNFLYIFWVSNSIDISFFNSPSRYLLIFYILLIPIIVNLIINFNRLLSIFILVLIFINNSYIWITELTKDITFTESLNKDKLILLNTIPKESYIFTSNLDKILFPDYKTIILNDSYYHKINKNFYTFVDSTTKIDYVCNLINNNFINWDNIFLYDIDNNTAWAINTCLIRNQFKEYNIWTRFKIYNLEKK